MKHIHVDIADDHPMIANGIKDMLYFYKHIELKNFYHSGEDLLNGLTSEQPDVLLLDIQMPDKTGNELARTIIKKYPKVNILVLTSMDDTFHLKDMMRSGCKGYLLKTVDKQTLLSAIEEVAEGGEYIQQILKERLVENVLKLKSRDAASVPLTRREKEILKLIATGWSSPQIGKKLNLSERTVQNHRYSLMQKLGTKNTVELLTAARKMGMLE